jgi:hypothetical protein
MKEFPTYEDANNGVVREWGIQAFITDKLLKDVDTAKVAQVENCHYDRAKEREGLLTC